MQITDTNRLLLEQSNLSDIFEKSLSGNRLSLSDCIRLLQSSDIHLIGKMANYLRNNLFGNRISFINNIILNYTNVCITNCKFCAFYRPPGHDDAYTVSEADVLHRVILSKQMFDIKQVLFQGGHNPELGIEYYESIFRKIKEKCPDVSIHGLSPSEIDMISRIERNSTKEVLSRLRISGLDSLPGAGAEILDDDVKKQISPLKIKSKEWLRIMEEAHQIGIHSSATMMYGTVDTIEQRANHIMKILELQEKTKGFMAFIPWSFEPNNTEIHQKELVRFASGGLSLLKMISVSRIMFYGLIKHIQSSWLTNGIGMAQLALEFGADDFGGTLIGEEVVSATGARSTELTENKIVSAISNAGFTPVARDNFYNIVKEYLV